MQEDFKKVSPDIIKVRIDYLNNNREVRHIFTYTDDIWFELATIIQQWATDIRVYKSEK